MALSSPTGAAAGPAGSGDPSGTAPSPEVGSRHLRLVGLCLALLSLPLVVALLGFRRHLWTPVLDLAMTELRVRDVGGRHTPLIGLPGRIGTLAQQGSHPGPASFYALAPVYRLLGSSAWALQVATALVHAVAMGTALVIADRRAGRRGVLMATGVLALLTAGYGAGTLTEPWNPYLPLLWWGVMLLAVWSVLSADLPMLPVAVVAGSFCAQTHVPYLGLALGLGALATVATGVHWLRAPGDRRRTVGWLGLAAVLGVVMWLPPTIDQVRHDPGNYRLLVEHFSDPAEEMAGLGNGVELGLRYLDLAHLVQGDVTDPGWLVTSANGHLPSWSRGLVLAVLWAASAVVAWRRRYRAQLQLHAVVAVALALMVLAISRIFGVVWYYLILWGWSIGVLALVAVVWTAAAAAAERRGTAAPARGTSSLEIALVALAVLVVGRFAVAAWDSPHADATVAAELAAVIGDVTAGLEAEAGVATGHDGRYLVTWSDAFHIGSQGYGLLSELERAGFDAGVEEGRRVPATAHRVLDPAAATARVHLATGAFVERWRAVPDAVEIASLDPRSAADRAEQARLRAEVIQTLEELGLDHLVPEVDANLFGAAIDQRVPDATKQQMGRMLEIGAPLSVFVVPVDVVDP